MKEQAEWFRALGDTTRLEILLMLADGEKCACDIQENFELKQPTISHHMKTLQQAGLIHVEKRGKWMFYTVNTERLAEMNLFVETRLTGKQVFPYRLADHDCEGERKQCCD